MTEPSEEPRPLSRPPKAGKDRPMIYVAGAVFVASLAAGVIYQAYSRDAPQQIDAMGKSINRESLEPQALGRPDELRLRPQVTFKECGHCPEMVAVAAGDFMMGSPRGEPGRLDFEGPVRKVTISNTFAAGRSAVTRDEFMAFVKATNHRYGETCHAQDANGWVERRLSVLSPGFPQDGRHPAVCVSWNDAVKYVEWLSEQTKRPYRLLTEAEREYITRAGTSTAFWWGATVEPDKANYDKRPRNQAPERPNSGKDPNRPGSTIMQPTAGGAPLQQPEPLDVFAPAQGTVDVNWGPPNEWGFHQMHGNVADWVQDCWNATYNGLPDDGTAATGGDCSRRVLRGGSWASWPEDTRAAYREMAGTDERFFSVGFRVARDLAK
jgi:formylglycine-generating enzyme required for sulfatase activity